MAPPLPVPPVVAVLPPPPPPPPPVPDSPPTQEAQPVTPVAPPVNPAAVPASAGLPLHPPAPDLLIPPAPAPLLHPTPAPLIPPEEATAAAVPVPAAVPIVVTVHEQEWVVDDTNIKLPKNNRNNNYRAWGVRDTIGNIHGPGTDRGRHVSRLDYFLMVFPPQQFTKMRQLTNRALIRLGKKPITKGELLKCFGVMILCTRHEFTSRSSLWSTTAPFKYINAAAFGKTGMARQRFDDLWRYMVWSEQPSERPAGMSHEKYRWLLVDGFVTEYNNHREQNFIPSDLICVDESISRWYGQGGRWINHGLPMYVAIDRKPDNGCEIQNACCGRSGIMMRLKLVKTAEEDRTHQDEHPGGMLHGTKVLLYLVKPWLHTNRTAVGDSYFASVGAAYTLDENGMGFIGVVKTATKKFPMAYLSNLEMQQRGERHGLITRGAEGDATLMAFVWMDRDRRYFIASSSSFADGLPHVRQRWRQVDTTLNADAERIELTVPQPKACEIYYRACGKIDGHNRHRQATLMLETKLPTQDWSKRVNMSLFAMTVVDSWLTFSACTDATETQKEYYSLLAEELIDNTYDAAAGPRRNLLTQNLDNESATLNAETGMPRGGVNSHITPTKNRRRVNGEVSTYLKQGRCTECRMKTTMCYSDCVDEIQIGSENAPRSSWICSTKEGKMCYANHMRSLHGV